MSLQIRRFFTPVLLILFLALSRVDLAVSTCSGESSLASPGSQVFSLTARISSEAIGPRKSQIAYPQIPSVSALHLPKEPPQIGLTAFASLSPGITDPLIEEARDIKAYDDFKVLSDAIPKKLTDAEKTATFQVAVRDCEVQKAALPPTASREEQQAAGRRTFLRSYLDGIYAFHDELEAAPGAVWPEWKLDATDRVTPAMAQAFTYTEHLLPTLARKTPEHSDGSLLPSPYPILIAAPGRFHEAYYWDSYFGLKGLLATGRIALAQGVVENFLHAIQQYGHVPNGMRDYYLTRSQPPFVSSMVREVYEASMQRAPKKEDRTHLRRWLKERAYPLLKHDYEDFWMEPKTRFDEKTGLNHPWDALNIPRPERHSFDDENKLGRSFRSVRSEAESGEDFTDAFERDASRVAGVLINSMLYKTETDSNGWPRSLEATMSARVSTLGQKNENTRWTSISGMTSAGDTRTTIWEVSTRIENPSPLTRFPFSSLTRLPRFSCARRDANRRRSCQLH